MNEINMLSFIKYTALLLLLSVFISLLAKPPASSNYHKVYKDIKYGDKFIVSDDFYGKGTCTVFSKGKFDHYYVHSHCSYDSGYQGKMIYNIKNRLKWIKK